MRTLHVPPEGFAFTAPMTLAAADPGGNGRRFSGVAYGGGVITDHGWWDAVAFDLAGVQAASPMPLLLQHDPERMIGVIDQVDNDGAQLRIGGRLFTGIDEHADAVAAKADAGAPWQLSVGIFPDRIEEIAAGSNVLLNGRQISGRAHVFRSARVRETSFVALGADGSTRAHVFNQAGARSVPLITATKEPSMADTNDTAAALAAMTAERDAEKARADRATADLAALQANFDARAKADREAAVKALLGESFTAELAAPYMDMTPAQFAAAQSLAASLRSKLPAGFTTEQARAGHQGAAASITPEAIAKYRRDNPGANYEQAFAALKTAA